MELFEEMAGSGKRKAVDAREADHDDTLIVDVLHEQVTFFGKKNISVCGADGESSEMDAADIVGPVMQSLHKDVTGDNILEAVRCLYECQCNKCIAETFGEDAPIDSPFLLCTLSDDDLTSPASCNFDFGDSDLHSGVGIDTVSLSCDTDVMKQKTFAEVVRGCSDASELGTAVTPAVWKFSLGKCEVTTQEIAAVSEDTGEAETSGDESTDSDEIKSDIIESPLPTVNRVSASGASVYSGCSDDAVPFATGCGNLSKETSELLIHSGTGGNDDCFTESDKTSNEAVDIGCGRDAESFTERCTTVDMYESRSGVVMVTEQLQTCGGDTTKVSVSVQCSPEQISFGCQVDLYDSDASDDVTSSSSYDDESGIDGDTECDVGEECTSFTRGGENTRRTVVGARIEQREIGGPLSVVVGDVDGVDTTSDDHEKETSLDANRDDHNGVVCDSSSMDSDEDGHETGESDDNDDVFKTTSESESEEGKTDESNSGVD